MDQERPILARDLLSEAIWVSIAQTPCFFPPLSQNHLALALTHCDLDVELNWLEEILLLVVKKSDQMPASKQC